MPFLNNSHACLAIVISAFILSACSPETTTNLNYPASTLLKNPTNTPAELRAIDNGILSVDVQIDRTGPIYKGKQDENGNWTVDLNISLDTDHSFVAKWFAMVGTQRIPVLEQRGNFYADSNGTNADATITQSISADEPQFDLDCDGMSNLDELADLNTDPLSLPGCESGAITNTTDPSPISITSPDVMQLTGGCFNMGSPEFYPEGTDQINVVRKADERQHEVCVEPFSIGIYEVTQAQWSQFDNSRRNNDVPIRNITREEADEYTTWLSNETGLVR